MTLRDRSTHRNSVAVLLAHRPHRILTFRLQASPPCAPDERETDLMFAVLLLVRTLYSAVRWLQCKYDDRRSPMLQASSLKVSFSGRDEFGPPTSTQRSRKTQYRFKNVPGPYPPLRLEVSCTQASIYGGVLVYVCVFLAQLLQSGLQRFSKQVLPATADPYEYEHVSEYAYETNLVSFDL